MLAGSFASTYHGDPRTTHDIDIVIDPDRNALDRLIAQLDAERDSISEGAVAEAWNRAGRFDVVITDSGWKVDLILRKTRPFSHQEFRRREQVDIGGVAAFLSKLAGDDPPAAVGEPPHVTPRVVDGPEAQGQ